MQGRIFQAVRADLPVDPEYGTVDAQMTGYARVLELIARAAPLFESMTALLELREAIVPGLRSSILLLDEDGVHMRHLVAPRLPRSYIEAVDGCPIGPLVGACGTAMFTRKQVFCEDLRTDPRWADYRSLAADHGLKSAWSTPILDAAGQVLGSFACYFDEPRRPTPHDLRMTDSTVQIASIAISRAREERRLRDSEAVLNAAQRVAHMGSFELDLRSGGGSWSREFFRVVGRDPALGVPRLEQFVQQYVHPDDRSALAERQARAVQSREPFSMEIRSNPADGTSRTYRVDAQPITDEQGVVFKFIGTLMDVTDRKALAAAARDSAVRLTLAVRSASVEIFEWDLTTQRLTFSPDWKRHLGYANGQVSDDFQTWRSRVHPEDIGGLMQGVNEFIERASGGFEAEFRLRQGDGTYLWVRSQGTVVRDDAGRPTRLLGSMIDISERKTQERALREQESQLRQLSRELLEAESNERRRLATELHDRVGQNLSSLVLNLGVLQRTLPLNDEARRRLTDSEGLLEQTINEVRTVMAELRPTELDDFGLLQSLTSAAQIAGDRAGFVVCVTGRDPSPPLHFAVETEIYRIALEALANVVKHAQARRVELQLEQDAESVTLRIHDDGRGLPSTAGTAGTRGLRGMRERAHALGAALRIDGVPEGGTVLTLTVPRA
jgi:PAS domain S-box-containing protein